MTNDINHLFVVIGVIDLFIIVYLFILQFGGMPSYLLRPYLSSDSSV